MREFRFLDEKRTTSGLTEEEAARWQELGVSLGIDLSGVMQAQPQGYYGPDGLWYPYPPGYDPNTGQYYAQQPYYPPQPQPYYDPNTGQYYPPQQPAYDPNAQAAWGAPQQGYYPPQQQPYFDPNTGQYYPPQPAYDPAQQQPAFDPNAQAWGAPQQPQFGSRVTAIFGKLSAAMAGRHSIKPIAACVRLNINARRVDGFPFVTTCPSRPASMRVRPWPWRDEPAIRAGSPIVDRAVTGSAYSPLP